MDILNKKIKGSTLVEVVVAMVIIMIAFNIYIIMWPKTTTYSDFIKKYTAQNNLKTYFLKNDITTENKFVIESELSKHHLSNSVMVKQIIIKGKSSEIILKKKIIIQNE